MGILGAALAGAAQGAGEGSGTALKEMQEQQGKMDLVKLQEQLDEQKQLRLKEVDQANYVTNQLTQNTWQGNENTKQRTLESQLEDKRIQGNKDVANISGGYGVQEANIRTAAEYARIRMEANHRTPFTDQQGRVWLQDMYGNTQPMIDPTTHQQIMGVKNVPENVMLSVKSLLDSANQADAMQNFTRGAQLRAQADQMMGNVKPLDMKGLQGSKEGQALVNHFIANASNSKSFSPQDISNFNAAADKLMNTSGGNYGMQLLAQQGITPKFSSAPAAGAAPATAPAAAPGAAPTTPAPAAPAPAMPTGPAANLRLQSAADAGRPGASLFMPSTGLVGAQMNQGQPQPGQFNPQDVNSAYGYTSTN